MLESPHAGVNGTCGRQGVCLADGVGFTAAGLAGVGLTAEAALTGAGAGEGDAEGAATLFAGAALAAVAGGVALIGTAAAEDDADTTAAW